MATEEIPTITEEPVMTAQDVRIAQLEKELADLREGAMAREQELMAANRQLYAMLNPVPAAPAETEAEPIPAVDPDADVKAFHKQMGTNLEE